MSASQLEGWVVDPRTVSASGKSVHRNRPDKKHLYSGFGLPPIVK